LGSDRNRGGREGAFQPEERGLRQVTVGLSGNPPLPKRRAPETPPGSSHEKRASERLGRGQPVERVTSQGGQVRGFCCCCRTPQVRRMVGAAANRLRRANARRTPYADGRLRPPGVARSHTARDGRGAPTTGEGERRVQERVEGDGSRARTRPHPRSGERKQRRQGRRPLRRERSGERGGSGTPGRASTPFPRGDTPANEEGGDGSKRRKRGQRGKTTKETAPRVSARRRWEAVERRVAHTKR